jgi:PH domain
LYFSFVFFMRFVIRLSRLVSAPSHDISRWKSRYFLLEAGILKYFESPYAAYNSRGKQLELSADSSVTYAPEENCFVVRRNGSDPSPDAASAWLLVASTEGEMDAWMTMINAHIHVRSLEALGSEADFWQKGGAGTSFWMLPHGHENPVGIRTLPSINAPRTSEGIYPGQVVEMVQVIAIAENNFLRLADDKGWVFSRHPKDMQTLLVRVEGTCLEGNRKYEYRATSTEPLTVYEGPSLDCDVMEDIDIEPGSTIHVCAVWTPSSQLYEDGSIHLTFLKLSIQRGWVVLQDLSTGQAVLSEIP